MKKTDLLMFPIFVLALFGSFVLWSSLFVSGWSKQLSIFLIGAVIIQSGNVAIKYYWGKKATQKPPSEL